MSQSETTLTNILSEYISSVSNMIDTHRRAYSDYTHSINELNSNLYQVMQLFFVLSRGNSNLTNRPNNINGTTTNNLNTNSSNNLNSNTRVNSFITPPRRHAPTSRTSNLPNRPRNFWHFPERRTTTSTWAPRRRTRNGNRITRRQNFLQQILQTSLYTPTMRRPATARDISRNTQFFMWSDIQNQTSQLRCPITLETFQPNDRVLRINNCGHIFHEDALNTYLNDYDHRCPICRYNISRDIQPPSSNTNTTSTNTTETYTNASRTSTNLNNNNNISNIYPNTSPIPSSTSNIRSNSTTNTSNTFTSNPNLSFNNTSTTYVSPVNSTSTRNTHNSTSNNSTSNNSTSNNSTSNNSDSSNTFWGFTTTSNSTNTNPTPLYRTDSFFNTDLSQNFSFNFTNTSDTPTFNLNLTDNNITEAINEISSAMLSALSHPDNSGNTISAEYSLFVPTFTTDPSEIFGDEDSVE